MKLNECTKEELIWVIKQLSWLDKSHLKMVLGDLKYERVKKKLAKAEEYGKIADDWRRKYIEILKKHEGKKLIDIPISDINEAERCLKEARKADKKYDELMKEVVAYGT